MNEDSRFAQVISAVERIQALPRAYVDCSYGQGRQAVLRQLEKRTGGDQADIVEPFITGAKEDLAALSERASPHSLPAEHVFS